ALPIFKLTGNFGQTRALLAGIKYAQGEYIATMDIDLQIGPENLKLFYDKSCQGFDMVSASRKRRKDNFLYRQLPSFFLNLIISRRVGIQLRDWGASFVVVKKSVADRILDYGENARFLKQIAAKLSDKVLEVDVDHYRRRFGRSRYGLLKLVTSSLDFLVNCRVESSGNKKELFQISEVRL
ncbi:MAG: glycosyltransferase, partial [Candidatus Omnitrophica bacterium]|nr:glycosyltransferase [Candidatus Omnitrophota bacterium]